MANLIIEGQPLASFVFEKIPSWNEVIEVANKRPRNVKSWKHARGPLISFTKKWRKAGYEMAHGFMDSMWEMFFERPALVETRAMVIVKVFRATTRTYDVHNVYCKAIFDGFSEAGIWRDDNWKFVPWVLYGWVQMTELEESLMGQCFVIEVYELDSVTLDGVAQVLPDYSEVL